MKKLLFGLLISLSASFAPVSQAYVYDFGTVTGSAISPVVMVPPNVAGGIDDFFFNIGGANPVTFASTVANVLPYVGAPVFAFPSFAATLYNLTNPGSSPFAASVDGQTLIFPFAGTSMLSPGDYRIQVTGSSQGAGGAYLVSLSVNAPPVPEPATYAMLFAGLGLIGTVAARRRARI
jgi:hypothetical protein